MQYPFNQVKKENLEIVVPKKPPQVNKVQGFFFLFDI